MDEATWQRCLEYAEELYAPESPAHRWIREELGRREMPLIQVSPLEGRLLAWLAAAAGARRVLEIGTLGGYSALWLLSLLPREARLVTLEKEPAHAALAREAFDRAGEERAEVRVGDARELLEQMEPATAFDVVFVDADKVSYPGYLRLVRPLLRTGAFLLADNALLEGAVAGGDPDPSEAVRAMREFNRTVAEDPDFEAVLVPIRDGLLVARFRGTRGDG